MPIIDHLRDNDAGNSALFLFSTVHRAKGREVPQAIMCDDFSDMMDGAVPVSLSREARESKNPESVWENARLRYVASTRPRFALRPDHQYLAYAEYEKAQSAEVSAVSESGKAE